MPHAIELDRKYAAKGLKVVLVHCQDRIDLAKFMYERFPRNRALVTADNPIAAGDTTRLALPRAALVGIDGKVLALGHRNEVGKLIDRLIPKELARMKEGYGADEVVARARAAFLVDMKFAETDVLLEQYRPQDEAAAKDAIEARVELHRRLDLVLDATRYRLDAGLYRLAATDLEALKEGVAGKPAWEERVALLAERLESIEGKAQLALEKKLERQLARAEKGVKKGAAASLRKLVAGHEKTDVGRRALRIASIWDRVEDG